MLLLLIIWTVGYFLTPGIFERLNKLSPGLQIGLSPFTLAFNDKTEVSLFNVPAFQLNNDRGLELSGGATYTIRASGAVVTAGWSLFPPVVARIARNHQDLPLRDIAESYKKISWRNPTGSYIYLDGESDANSAPQCVQDKSKELKLLPNANYGALLGLVVSRNEAPQFSRQRDGHSSNYAVFLIGEGGTITFDPKGKSVSISRADGARESLNLPFVQGDLAEIRFVINDAVITSSEDFDLPANCVAPAERAWRKVAAELYGAMPARSRAGVWYLDNDGNFSVTVQIVRK
jgi:hypothetical protein